MQYQVDSEAVMTATGQVRASIGRIQAEVAALHGQLMNLQASWTGQASAGFQSAVTSWKSTEQRVAEELGAMNVALGQAGQQYAEVEAANARLFLH